MITIIIPEWMAWAIAGAVTINIVLTTWSIYVRRQGIAVLKRHTPHG